MKKFFVFTLLIWFLTVTWCSTNNNYNNKTDTDYLEYRTYDLEWRIDELRDVEYLEDEVYDLESELDDLRYELEQWYIDSYDAEDLEWRIDDLEDEIDYLEWEIR